LFFGIADSITFSSNPSSSVELSRKSLNAVLPTAGELSTIFGHSFMPSAIFSDEATGVSFLQLSLLSLDFV